MANDGTISALSTKIDVHDSGGSYDVQNFPGASATSTVEKARSPSRLDPGSFDKIWNMPNDFIEPVNVRRGGWGGVSVFESYSSCGWRKYFVKRQENQQRYSLSYPFGVLTYQYEADVLLQLTKAKLPVVELVCFGFRRIGRKSQGILVTREVPYSALSDLNKENTDWYSILPSLTQAGNRLYEFHRAGWQHGSLYPQHLFIDVATGESCLIDLECARKCMSLRKAIEKDLSQLIKRTKWMPVFALNALLTPYLKTYPDILKKIDVAIGKPGQA